MKKKKEKKIIEKILSGILKRYSAQKGKSAREEFAILISTKAEEIKEFQNGMEANKKESAIENEIVLQPSPHLLKELHHDSKSNEPLSEASANG